MKFIFTQPFLVNEKLAEQCVGNVVVLDIAFNGGSPQGEGTLAEQFERTTKAFIDALGTRLNGWVDHHDHANWSEYKNDPRFVLVPRQDAPACPPIITPQLIDRLGNTHYTDTIVAHGDFDGIMSAIKYYMGKEPYIGADADSIAADSRIGTMSLNGHRYEAALKANLADDSIRQAMVAEATWEMGMPDDVREAATQKIETAAYAYAAIQKETEKLSHLFNINGRVAWLDAAEAGAYDLTQLLLAGQKQAAVALVRNVQRGKNQITIAGPKGWNFVQLFGLLGGMPNRVNLSDSPIEPLIEKINQA